MKRRDFIKGMGLVVATSTLPFQEIPLEIYRIPKIEEFVTGFNYQHKSEGSFGFINDGVYESSPYVYWGDFTWVTKIEPKEGTLITQTYGDITYTYRHHKMFWSNQIDWIRRNIEQDSIRVRVL